MADVIIPKGTSDLSTVSISDSDSVFAHEGSQLINAGTDLSGLTNGLTEVFFGPSTAISIDPSAPLRVDVDQGAALFRNYAGGGHLYVRPNGNSNVITTYEHLGRGKTTFTAGGTVTTLSQRSGEVFISEDVSVTTFNQRGGDCNAQYKSTVFTTLRVGGGNLRSGRGFTTAFVTGGAHCTFRREDTSATTPAGTTLNIMQGTVRWAGGDITTVNLLGPDAILDLSEAPYNLTIGTLNVFGDDYNKSSLASQFATVTITSENVLAGPKEIVGKGGGGGTL